MVEARENLPKIITVNNIFTASPSQIMPPSRPSTTLVLRNTEAS